MNDRGVFPKGSSLEVHERHGIPCAQKHRMTLCWQCYFVCLPDIILSRLTRFFPEKILKSKVTLDLIEHGIGASDSPKNTWSTCICFLGSAWKYRNTVSGQLPARQCRIQNWFVLGIQRTSARVLFIHVCTSILKESVLFHWVHDALDCWNWGEGISMIECVFHFMIQNPGAVYLLKKCSCGHLPKICALLWAGQLIIGISAFYIFARQIHVHP
jgi:hypothetical protein